MIDRVKIFVSPGKFLLAYSQFIIRSFRDRQQQTFKSNQYLFAWIQQQQEKQLDYK